MRTVYFVRPNKLSPHPEERREAARLEGWPHARRSPKKVTHALESDLILSRVTARCSARSHEADREAGGRESGAGDQASRTRAGSGQPQPAGGAPGGAASGRRASQTRHCGTRAPQGGPRKPTHDGAYTPRSQGACKGAVAQRPGASRRSIPSSEGEENRERVYPHPAEWAAERWLRLGA